MVKKKKKVPYDRTSELRGGKGDPASGEKKDFLSMASLILVEGKKERKFRERALSWKGEKKRPFSHSQRVGAKYFGKKIPFMHQKGQPKSYGGRGANTAIKRNRARKEIEANTIRRERKRKTSHSGRNRHEHAGKKKKNKKSNPVGGETVGKSEKYDHLLTKVIFCSAKREHLRKRKRERVAVGFRGDVMAIFGKTFRNIKKEK